MAQHNCIKPKQQPKDLVFSPRAVNPSLHRNALNCFPQRTPRCGQFEKVLTFVAVVVAATVVDDVVVVVG